MNRRLFFFSFLTVAAGILTGVLLRQMLYILLPLLFLCTVFSLFLKKQRFLALALTVFFAVGSLSAVFSYKEYTQRLEDCAISGRVESILPKSETLILVQLKDVTLFTPEAQSLSGRVQVLLSNAEGLAHGNEIMVYGKLYPYTNHAENPGEIASTLSNLADDIGYGFSASRAEILSREKDIGHWLYQIKNAVRQKIDAGVPDKDCAAILYAMITGDKSNLASYLSSLFSESGVAHLLAVSGLHVGILLTLLGALIKLLHLPSGIKLTLTSAFLLFYCLLTGFSPSIVRASLMALLTLGAGILGMRYDMLNALGFAGTIMLLCNPYRLFDLAFQLSFASCFGIAVFTRPRFRRFPRLLNALAVTCGATIGTLPIALYNFHYIPTVTLFANLLLVPVASLALLTAVIALLLSFLWNGFTALFTLPYWLMTAILKITEPLSRLPKITTLVFAAAVIPLFLLLLLLGSRFVRLKPGLKRSLAVLLTAVMLVLGAQNYLPRRQGAELRVLSLQSGQCVHVLAGGKHFIVGLHKDSLLTQLQYIGRNIGRVDGVFLLSAQEAEALPIAITAGLEAETIYLLDTLSSPDENVLFSPVKLAPGQEIQCGDALFCIEGEGLHILCRGTSAYIHPPQSNKIPQKMFDIAVTENPHVQAKTIISRSTVPPVCQTLYRTCYYGMVRCIIKEDMQFKTFHEVLP